MTKTELQIALAEATQTNKRTAALFLGPEDLLRLLRDQEMARKRRSKEELKEEDALVEPLGSLFGLTA